MLLELLIRSIGCPVFELRSLYLEDQRSRYILSIALFVRYRYLKAEHRMFLWYS